MKAVFLDRNTFSPDVALPAPEGVLDWRVFDATPNDTAIVVSRLEGAQIAITNKVLMTREILARLPALKVIQITATGVNNVDLSACEAFGVQLFNVAGYSTTTVPEHTFAMILAAMRGLVSYHNNVIDGSWQRDGRFCLNELPILDLQGKTLGIVGVGNIGKRVTEIAKAFGMHVLWAERRGVLPRSPEYTDFDEVFSKSDIITLHCPLNDASYHLLNTETLALCRNKPLIVNMARGPVADSAAVAAALDDEWILGYASDVFEEEPPIADDPLLRFKNHPRVVFTPHNAWASIGAQEELWRRLCRQISTYIAEK
ncbi:MAG: NAD(P)-dependent oxidoreductase [Cardiobacteriaceae bacterium]|nr:NAD(P)-dependent oxidoreductase [Cardiobacteriaceae bacterium]